MSRFRFLCFVALVGHASLAEVDGRDLRITLPAAGVDRTNQTIAAPLPADAPDPASLRSPQGIEVPVQIDDGHMAHFIVPRQASGETLTYTLVSAGRTPAAAGTEVVRRAGDLQIQVGGDPLLGYRMDQEALPRKGIDDKFKRAGYLHPVYSPAGKLVTADYPSNHVHHHAIWTAWSQTKFEGRSPNFWEMGEQTGSVEFVALDRVWNGPVEGGFAARQRMVDLSAPAPVTVLNETWDLTAYAVPPTAGAVRIFDLAIKQTCATPDPIELVKYRYGGLGFRGSEAWEGKNGLAVLTSEGATDRNQANGTRCRWCYLGAVAATGAREGIAILCDPDNFRAPQPIRIHPDMPFFSFNPSGLGDFAITPEKPYLARYRFVVTDDPPAQAWIESYWNAYAHPARPVVAPL